MSVSFFTGASRGFGAEIVEKALAAGFSRRDRRDPRAISARSPDAGDQLLPVALDVLDEAQAAASVEAAVRRFGGVDVVVNDAGRGLLSAVEEASDSAARRSSTPTSSASSMCCVRSFRRCGRSGSGRIIDLSSIDRFTGSAGSVSSAPPSSRASRKRLHARSARSASTSLSWSRGYFRTDFLDASSLSTEGIVIDDYAETAGATRQHATDVNHAQPGDPVKAAAAIVEIASAERRRCASSWVAIPLPRLPTNFSSSPRNNRPGATCRCQRITTTWR